MHNRTRWRKDENSRIFKLLLHLILSDIWRNIKETFHWLNWMHSWRKARSVWPNFFAILSSTYILHESCKKKVKSFAKQFPHISTHQWTISTIHIFQSIGEKMFQHGVEAILSAQHSWYKWFLHLSKFYKPLVFVLLNGTFLTKIKFFCSLVSDLKYFAPILHIF